ncbi:TBC1 domain family member 30 [Mytilus edulis]|uniref:TBC1 domain family member 30 n=1 Tax=Mytilus edulis TaxID=6550 RepID=A0A8S3ULS1_MYTED|nr:TBC1 domain family member 30 [Mytilus edulis]
MSESESELVQERCMSVPMAMPMGSKSRGNYGHGLLEGLDLNSESMDDTLFDLSEQRSSIVDDLLFEIYDRWHDARHDSFESDTFTECSSTSDIFPWRKNSIHLDIEAKHSGKLNRSTLESQSLGQVRKMVSELQYRNNCMSARLVRQLKRRERRLAKLQHNFDIVTAIIQASSQKRRIDTRMKFSIEPPPGDSAFEQWKDAMKAVARLPMGIPDSFSTGCSGFSGHENEEDRASLKRVLLGFARWNKSIGYCQGFNVIAALLLDVTERREDEALKVMIYIIDKVLPESYYVNNLRALSVDMAVFRDLLRITYPKLSRHLDMLQSAAQDNTTGACYEPPLTNVFTMQWFLTMFATCLPKEIVLRVWDSLLLEGSEILLRTGLAIWGKLSRRILSAGSADDFYSLMGSLTQDMMSGKMITGDSLIKSIYTTAAFDSQLLIELREKYTYNIRPFSSTANTNNNTNKSRSFLSNMLLPSDEDEIDEEDLEAINCFPGFFPVPVPGGKTKGSDGEENNADISKVGPGAYGASGETQQLPSSIYMERMCTDINSLKKQYNRLKQRQNQAHIIIAAASASQQHVQHQKKPKIITPKIETPTALNHLFVGRNNATTRNRCVAASPRIASVYPQLINDAPSRRNSIQKNSKLELGVKGQSAKTEKNVECENIVKTDRNMNIAQENDDIKNIDDNHNEKEDEVGRHDSAVAESCDITTESKQSMDENELDNHMYISGNLNNSSSITPVDSLLSLSVEDGTNKSSQNSHVVENQNSGTYQNDSANTDTELNENVSNIIEECNTCNNDSHRHSLVIEGSENVHGSLDLSNDSGLFSTTNSLEIDNSPKINSNELSPLKTEKQEESSCHHNGSVASHESIAHSKSKSDSCEESSPLKSVHHDSKKATVERSVSADPSSTFEADDSQTSRTRSFSTDQALSDYAKSKSKPSKMEKPFNPFPVKHFNENRKKNCVKLGLYKTSTLQEFERQCKSKFLWSK